jgi:NAD dependent epimerase/dehydratase family enzyme
VTNAEFTKALGKALSRPTLFPIPAFGVRLAFGEMADALLLASQRVEPVRLKDLGYNFKHSEIGSTLSHVLR